MKSSTLSWAGIGIWCTTVVGVVACDGSEERANGVVTSVPAGSRSSEVSTAAAANSLPTSSIAEGAGTVAPAHSATVLPKPVDVGAATGTQVN
jgi:hypothetical protein